MAKLQIGGHAPSTTIWPGARYEFLSRFQVPSSFRAEFAGPTAWSRSLAVSFWISECPYETFPLPKASPSGTPSDKYIRILGDSWPEKEGEEVCVCACRLTTHVERGNRMEGSTVLRAVHQNAVKPLKMQALLRSARCRGLRDGSPKLHHSLRLQNEML